MALDFDTVANVLVVSRLTAIIKDFTEIVRSADRAYTWDQIITNLPHEAQLMIEERGIQHDSVLVMSYDGKLWIIKKYDPIRDIFLLYMRTDNGAGEIPIKTIARFIHHSIHLTFEQFLEVMEKEIASISS